MAAEPLIVGGVGLGGFGGPGGGGGGGGGAGGAVIVMTNAASEALAPPSLTVTTMLAVSPTSASEGMPVSSPVAVLKLAHSGLLTIEKMSVPPSASEAVGRKLYVSPACTVVDGVPPIVIADVDDAVDEPDTEFVSDTSEELSELQPARAARAQMHSEKW